MSAIISSDLSIAVEALRAGEVIAYPTESCFGLGCDPSNQQAVEKVISIKQRSADKGLILIAADIEQASRFVSLDSQDLKPQLETIQDSWPGPNTWLLPPHPDTLKIVRGEFPLLAIRVTAHPSAKAICELFGGAIVSTSANLAGEPMLTDINSVNQVFGKQIQVIVDKPIGNANKPSLIRDGLSGKTLRQ